MRATYHHPIFGRLSILGYASLLVITSVTPAVGAQTHVDQRSASRAEPLRPTATERQTKQTTSRRPDGSTKPLRAPSPESSESARRPLARRGDSVATGSTHNSNNSLWTVTGSLALVLGVLAAFLWISRRTGWTNSQTLPGQAIRVLGGTPLDARHQLRLVRIGNRVVALAVSATSVQSIAEIREPEEVARLTSLCNDGTGPAITELVDTDFSQPTLTPRGQLDWDAATTQTKHQRERSPVRG